MASVEITDNTIIRSLVRKGTNDERRQITLEEGELGYTTDTKRLFVGDAVGSGVIAGTKYLGAQASWPASLTPQPGDFFTLGGGLYARKNNIGEDDNLGEPEGYDRIGLAGNPGNGLVVTDGNLNVSVDNTTINFTFDNKLQVNNIQFSNLPDTETYTLLGNSGGSTAKPSDIAVGENSVLGRISTSNLQSTTFDEILTNAQDPTMTSLKLTGLAGLGNKPIYVDNNGNITTTSSFTTNFLASNPSGGNYLGVTYYNAWAGTTTSNNVTLAADLSSFTNYNDYLGYGVSMVIDAYLNVKAATLDIDDVKIAVQNFDITWDQIQDFHFQYTGGHNDGGTGFFGYLNALAASNIMLTALPFNIRNGKQRARYDASYHVIPNSYAGTEELIIHVGSNTDLPAQVRLVGITIRG
jgi:hypothetical protein